MFEVVGSSMFEVAVAMAALVGWMFFFALGSPASSAEHEDEGPAA